MSELQTQALAELDLTEEQFKEALPKQMKKSVNKQLIDQINKSITDPIFKETYRDNLLGYISVMQEGRFKMQQYLDAVKYVSYKLMGDTNIAAYTKTFPNRYQNFVQNGTSSKDIASYVTSYNKNKLVNLILEQTLIPTHIINADIFQRAINTQAELMIGASSEKVRSDAANSLLTHLKPPETKKVELDIGLKEDNVISDLRNTIADLANEQQRMVSSGFNDAKEVAHSKIIDITPEGE